MSVLLATDLPFPAFRRGKVRDVYDLGSRLLMVATDRISAFDCIMPEGIPDKGRILTQVANFWFGATRDILPNHLEATRVEDFPAGLQPFEAVLRGRSILVRKTAPLPVECVVRGHLAGSGLKEYQKSGTVCGIALPPGPAQRRPACPSPSSPHPPRRRWGHDENIDFAAMARLWAGAWRPGSGTRACPLPPGPGPGPGPGHHPGRHQVRVRPAGRTASRSSSTRC